jgi:phosphate:Na+ symporter
MSAWSSILALAGGLGLFLLGMGLMTDGLKLAAGPALHHILANATRTRWQALGSGALVTAMVQSSTAVGVAAIGFVNAGLLGLAPAVWVVFGANVGTSMTSWIVALVGLKFQVEALALPLIGLGAVMRLSGEHQRRAALGTALAGFGLLFMGIAWLKEAFLGLSDQVQLPQGDGVLSVLAQLGIGVLMTVVMQSSSAAMTITLAAAQSGLIGPQGAAAVVIGANIGSAVTTALAGLGGTPNARRTAAAHVAFNLLTGAAALLLLPWLIQVLNVVALALGLQPDPATQLAMFHTSFNLLGVLLMWPLADALIRWLGQRFRAREEDLAQARYLDNNVLAVPTLALDALTREMARLSNMGRGLLRSVLAGDSLQALAQTHTPMQQLSVAIDVFVEHMNRSALTPEGSARLAELLRIQRYDESAAEQALAAAPLQLPPAQGVHLNTPHQHFVQATLALLDACQSSESSPPAAAPEPGDVQRVEERYQALKAAVLASAASGALPLPDMEELLKRYSAVRRAVQQSDKARQRLQALH